MDAKKAQKDEEVLEVALRSYSLGVKIRLEVQQQEEPVILKRALQLLENKNDLLRLAKEFPRNSNAIIVTSAMLKTLKIRFFSKMILSSWNMVEGYISHIEIEAEVKK